MGITAHSVRDDRMDDHMDDDMYMTHALKLAKRAGESGEVPVGALVVLNNKIIGSGNNQPINNCDPTAHAEIIALRAAAATTRNYRLTNAVLYVTLEPCIMCAGAILHARITRLVYAAADEKSGAAGSALNLLQSPFLNHQCTITAGICANDATKLLQDFFANRRL